MLITFHSKSVAEVLMLSAHAVPLLRAAGKSIGDDVPAHGVISLAQLPDAIAGIEAALKSEAPPPAEPDGYNDDEPPVPAMAQHVSLHQRAFPLLDMMRRSLANGHDVTWEASKGW
jgi:hypothetical protein